MKRINSINFDKNKLNIFIEKNNNKLTKKWDLVQTSYKESNQQDLITMLIKYEKRIPSTRDFDWLIQLLMNFNSEIIEKLFPKLDKKSRRLILIKIQNSETFLDLDEFTNRKLLKGILTEMPFGFYRFTFKEMLEDHPDTITLLLKKLKEGLRIQIQIIKM